MSNVLRLAIVDPSDSARDSLKTTLLGLDMVWLEAECSRYEFFLDVISQSQPDVAVVSLDSDQTKALALIGQLTADRPEVPILAISAFFSSMAISSPLLITPTRSAISSASSI